MSKNYERKAIEIVVVSADSDTQVEKHGGGTYPGAEIIYKAFGKTETKGIHANTFKFKPEVKAQIDAMTPKSKWTMNLYREEGGKFWNVDSFVEGHGHAKPSSSSSGNQSQGSASFNADSPNPAAVGQVLNLAIEMKLIKKLDDLQDANVARSVVAQVKAAKEAIAAVWNDAEKQHEEEIHSSNSRTDNSQSDGFNDDVPF